MAKYIISIKGGVCPLEKGRRPGEAIACTMKENLSSSVGQERTSPEGKAGWEISRARNLRKRVGC